MGLTTERMQKILLDELNSPPAQVNGPEEEAFLAGIRKDIQHAKENGYMIEVPAEWPDISDSQSAKSD